MTSGVDVHRPVLKSILHHSFINNVNKLLKLLNLKYEENLFSFLNKLPFTQSDIILSTNLQNLGSLLIKGFSPILRTSKQKKKKMRKRFNFEDDM